MTFIGVLLIISCTILFVIKKASSEGSALNKAVSAFGNWFYSLGIVVGLLLTLLNSLFFYAEAGYSYLLVYPNGKKDAIMREGWHPRYFAEITAWQKSVDVKAGEGNDDPEIEGKSSAIGIRYIDQVTADMETSVRFSLPNDKEQFIKLAVSFRSMGNLVNNTLIPTIKEQAIQTGYMYSAQNYISGSAQAFRQTFEEQLKDGAYKVVKKTYKDTSYTTSITDSVRSIKEINTRYVVEKVMENGVPVRIPHEIVKTGIIVNQVIVDRVILDPDYQERLTKQKEESAKRQLEQQKIETAKIAQVRIKAEGERDKEMERVTQERKQVAQLIAIETELKQEKTSLELAKIQLETAKANSAKAKVKADAQYYTNTKMVQAGLTPQQKAEWAYKTKVGIAEQIKDMNVPKIITSGGGSGGNGDVNTLIQLKVLETLSKE